MRTRSLTFALVGSVAAAVCGFADESETRIPTRPHILVILADDLGWRDVGYHDSEIPTPRIDEIARAGIELDRFYVQPTCSPTRTALMTGKSPASLGVNRPISKNEVTGLPLRETLLPEYLAREGYQPLMVGKWHLGHHTPDYFPQARGFEHFYGHLTGGIGYWDHNHGGGHDWQRNGETLREDGYSTTLMADEAIRIIQTRDRERPTFLYLAFNAPHLPNEAPAETIRRFESIEDENRRTHAAMVSELDLAIGRVLDAFEREGMLDETLIFFSSDNGGLARAATPAGARHFANFLVRVFGRPIPVDGLEFLVANILDGASDNSPLPGGKGSVAEGGSRVPAAIWWPGVLEGGTHDGFITISDLLPTLLEAIGASASTPADLNGRSRWAELLGGQAAKNEGATNDKPDYVTMGIDGMALYRPPWKLVDPGSPRLYQIYADPFEEHDLAADHPDLVRALTNAADAWPRGRGLDRSILDILLDPDRFGGAEDRDPWADVARRRAGSN